MKISNGHTRYQRFAAWLSPFFSTRYNPLYHLAEMAIFMLVLATISGIYLFFFYNVDPYHSYESVEKLSRQWVGGVMRSVHRYASDLLVVFVLMHLLHMLLTGKYRRVLSWVTGIGSFLVVVLLGVTGYMLVWDEKSKLLGILTAKFLAAAPVFDPAITGAFLLNDLQSVGGFFRIALFGHIFFTLFIAIVIWLHVAPVARPKLWPPRQAMIVTGAVLLGLCLVFPARSDPPAQAVVLPTRTTFDWFFFFGYYFMKVMSPAANWLLMFGSGMLLAVLPYLKRRHPLPHPTIDLDSCDGCDQCVRDCPYAAIDLLPQTEGPHAGTKKAILDPSKCVGCTVCVAACHVDAIAVETAPPIAQPPVSPRKKELTVYRCYYAGVKDEDLPEDTVRVPCLGGIHPKAIKDQLEHHAEGVALVGCEDCFYRYGRTLEELRLNRKRRPTFFRRAPLQRVRLIAKSGSVRESLEQFKTALKHVDDKKIRNALEVVEYRTYRPLFAAAVTLLFFLFVPPLSNSSFSFYQPDEKMLILNFRYVSSPTEYQELRGGPAHMHSAQPVVKSRSAILVTVEDERGRRIFEKRYEPRGLRKDIAIFVYAEITTEAERVRIRIAETAFPDKIVSSGDIALDEANGTVIVYKNGKLQRI